MEPVRAVKGMNDVLPAEVGRWQALEHTFRTIFGRAAFREVRTPLVESTRLFVRTIGEATDVVEKEMYSFERGDEALTIRPEGTASAVRAYVEHKFYANAPLAKWFYLGPMFRAERPQKGRYRQFYQVGAEVLGIPGPAVDAEVIALAVSFLEALGIKDLDVIVNTIGGAESRERYKAELVAFLTPKLSALSPDSQRRLAKNPLRILDSKSPLDAEALVGAPLLEACLTEHDRVQFALFQTYLEAQGVRFRVDPKLVRGLDYYTQTLFEIKGAKEILGAGDTLCGGGRYDGMVRELGGNDQPAFGFAAGVERLLFASPSVAQGPEADVLIAPLGEACMGPALKLAADLRTQGFAVELATRPGKLGAALTRANTVGAQVALILGEDEIKAGTVQVKTLASGEQSAVAQSCVAEELLQRGVKKPYALQGTPV